MDNMEAKFSESVIVFGSVSIEGYVTLPPLLPWVGPLGSTQMATWSF